MCGIFSGLLKEGKNYDEYYENLLKIKHRGPDDTKFKIYDKFVAGFHRLAIVDLSEKSNQPLVLNDLVLVCNGEIFNHKELEKKYNLHCEGSDCEVILHLYDKFGCGASAIKKIVCELEAEFAFVLYDGNNKKVYAARDPFGVRPLFWGRGGGVFFASELKGLSFLNEVKPFKPGHIYDGEELVKYYEINLSKNPDDNVYENIRKIVENAVSIRLMSDRPVGCFLSGGLDSSLVVAIVSKYIPDIQCFSIGLDGGEDIEAARKVVEFLNARGRNIKHHIVNFMVEDGFNALCEVIYHLESYDITTIRASVPQYLLSKYISKNTDIKVLYSGEGADEVQAGYLYSKFAPDENALEKDLKRLVEELYMFDNLRVDRTTAAFGLEVRIPFLDTKFVNYMFSIPMHLKTHTDKIEKQLIRDAFKYEDLLPDEVLYRKKAAFSDAVSSASESWYKTLSKKYIEVHISDDEFLELSKNYLHNKPPTKEALYYRIIFDELFEGRDKVIEHYWMPSWCDTNGDPSATVLKFK